MNEMFASLVSMLLLLYIQIIKPGTKPADRAEENSQYNAIARIPAELDGMRNDYEIAVWLSDRPAILDLAVKMHVAKQSCTFNTSTNVMPSPIAPITPSIAKQSPTAFQGNASVSCCSSLAFIEYMQKLT